MGEIEYGVVVALIVGVVEALKRMFGLGKRWTPGIAVLLSIGAMGLWLYPGDWKMALFYGIMAGLSAVGLYSGAKNTANK